MGYKESLIQLLVVGLVSLGFGTSSTTTEYVESLSVEEQLDLTSLLESMDATDLETIRVLLADGDPVLPIDTLLDPNNGVNNSKATTSKNKV